MARWTRRETLLALNLYLETPFGKQHKTYPPIVALAGTLGRTPSSVGMKLCNFTSLHLIQSNKLAESKGFQVPANLIEKFGTNITNTKTQSF